MNFNNLTTESIKQLPGDELVDLMYSTFEDLMDIQFIKMNMSDLANRMSSPDFDILKREIKYEQQEDSFHIKVPRVQEEKEYLSKTWKCELENYCFFPESGSFVDCDSELTVRAYGLIEITHTGKSITRMNKNHTFLNRQKSYTEESFFYFDYKEKAFIQAPGDQLRKLRLNIQMKSDEASAEALEYHRREQLLHESYHRLKEISIEKGYQKHFLEFVNTDNKSLNIEDIKDYLTKYYRFLTNDLEAWLRIKLLFSSITKDEYIHLLNKRDELMKLIYRYTEGKEELHDVLSKLKRFKEVKPETVTPGLLMQGFIHYDSEKKVLYPTIVEIERRRLLRLDSFYDDDSYKKYLEDVMDSLDKKRT